MQRRTLLVTSLITMAVGCTAESMDDDSESSIDGPIDYHLSGGFDGRGDASAAVHIEPDGTMTKTPPVGQPKVTMLSKATLRSLHDKLEAADFSSLAESYFCCPDDYVHLVSVGIQGAVKMVRAGEMAEKPRTLEIALDALHDLALP